MFFKMFVLGVFLSVFSFYCILQDENHTPDGWAGLKRTRPQRTRSPQQ